LAASSQLQMFTPYCSKLRWPQNSILHSEHCLHRVCPASLQGPSWR